MDMKYIISFMFLLQAIINNVNLAKAEIPNPKQQQFICRNTGDFKNDTLLKSRDEAFDQLFQFIKSMPYTGFLHTQGGYQKWETKVNVIVLCRPTVKREVCEDCLKNTVPYLKKNCPRQKEAAAWSSLMDLSCMVRYVSERSIYQELDDWGWVSFSSPEVDAKIVGDLEKALNTLATKLQGEAAGGDSSKKFAVGNVPFGSGPRKLEGHMQCTPDLSKEDCIKCLTKATKEMHSCCAGKGKMSGRMLSTNCFMKYVLPK